eukprot:127181-Chlamydomonas_euryale.AAC.1
MVPGTGNLSVLADCGGLWTLLPLPAKPAAAPASAHARAHAGRPSSPAGRPCPSHPLPSAGLGPLSPDQSQTCRERTHKGYSSVAWQRGSSNGQGDFRLAAWFVPSSTPADARLLP